MREPEDVELDRVADASGDPHLASPSHSRSAVVARGGTARTADDALKAYYQGLDRVADAYGAPLLTSHSRSAVVARRGSTHLLLIAPALATAAAYLFLSLCSATHPETSPSIPPELFRRQSLSAGFEMAPPPGPAKRAEEKAKWETA